GFAAAAAQAGDRFKDAIGALETAIANTLRQAGQHTASLEAATRAQSEATRAAAAAAAEELRQALAKQAGEIATVAGAGEGPLANLPAAAGEQGDRLMAAAAAAAARFKSDSHVHLQQFEETADRLVAQVAGARDSIRDQAREIAAIAEAGAATVTAKL